MKRPPKLRPSSAGHLSMSSSNSMLSRVPLLHVNEISLAAWDVGDQIPGLRIPLAPLITSSATTEAEILTALLLVADTVAEQRQLAAKCILAHPAILGPSTMLFLTIAKLLHTGSPSDLVLTPALWSLCSLLALLAIRSMVRGYATIAEHVGSWAWLAADSVNGTSQRRDEVLVARCAGEIVGVLVLRIAKTKATAAAAVARPGGAANGAGVGIGSMTGTGAGAGPLKPRSSRRKSSARWTGIIRAWSVKQSHRRCGVGARLLEEAVGYCRLRNLDGPFFADDHANATQVLPGMFHGSFLAHDRWARGFLEQLIILIQKGRGFCDFPYPFPVEFTFHQHYTLRIRAQDAAPLLAALLRHASWHTYAFSTILRARAATVAHNSPPKG
ncbi:acetyltransferase [Histoplasma capsulatum H143]|uniref:Acetyltransferase n=1 Tax=Ajellomyces capsulatus (strain H143) TaxID=544712 RepID=C6HL07_AJECH|nr:acetyltransferase [Histoplasma capsulatum H143]